MPRTATFTFITLLVVALYDLWAVVRYGAGSSISQWIVEVTHVSPIQAFVAGALCAHFFGWMLFPRTDKKPAPTEPNKPE